MDANNQRSPEEEQITAERAAANLGISARGTLPVPSQPRPYPTGFKAWPWRRLTGMLAVLLGAIAVLIALTVIL